MSAGVVTCVILAGGLGTRLRGTIGAIPKCLAPVGDRTFLEVQMARLAEAGVTQIVLSLGYGADQVTRVVARTVPPVPVRHVIEPELRGTGGALAYALDKLGLDEVLVVNGDTYLTGELVPMFVPLDRSAGELFRIGAVTVPDRRRFGGLVRDSGGRLQDFLEKGVTGPGLINAGLYRVCRKALPEGDAAYSLERDVLPTLVRQGAATVCELNGEFIDIGVPEDYMRFVDEYGR